MQICWEEAGREERRWWCWSSSPISFTDCELGTLGLVMFSITM
jgi:hypothetical protein